MVGDVMAKTYKAESKRKFDPNSVDYRGLIDNKRKRLDLETEPIEPTPKRRKIRKRVKANAHP